MSVLRLDLERHEEAVADFVGGAFVGLDDRAHSRAAGNMLLEFAGVGRATAQPVNGEEGRLVAAQQVDVACGLKHQRHVDMRLVGEAAVERVETRRIERADAEVGDLGVGAGKRARDDIARDPQRVARVRGR